ncbi:pentapeptide repeat-containing protein, partial [Aneurinibacillus aneurinilyticus]
MVKEDVVRHFTENEVQIKTLESLLALEEYFQTHKDELVHDFVQSFREICRKIKAMQSRGEKG